MLLILKVECVRGSYLKADCIRVLAMDDSASLHDLYDMIQDAVSFDRDHPYDFYTANSASPWAERHWVIDIEDWDKKEAMFWDTQLKEIWPLGRRKLYYWFDFGDDWIFEIRKVRHRTTAAQSTPRLIERIGPNPEQYPAFDE